MNIFLTERAPVTFESDGQKVFGVIHRPRAEAHQRYPGIVIFHGLVGSKDQPHQIFVKLAEALAKAGFVALRIDFRGRGDSEGDTVDITPEGDLRDARKALDFLEAQPDVDPKRLGAVGLSWGGVIAAILAGRDPRLTATVLWNSAGEVHEWSPPFKEVEGRQVFEMWGNLVGSQFYAGVRHIFPHREITQARGPVLIVQSTADEASDNPIATAERLKQRLAEAGVPHELMVIAGADHAFMSYAWEREVIERTVAWLRSALDPGFAAAEGK